MAQDVASPVAKGSALDAVANARQRLEEQRTALGDRHPDFASSLIQLALLLIMHNQPDEAEPLLREALDIRRESLGERHPDYATCLSSLAGLLWARGDLDGAEPMLRQALRIRQDSLGERHPKSIVILNSLEQLLLAKSAQAELVTTASGEPEPVAAEETAPAPADLPASAAESEPAHASVPAEPEPTVSREELVHGLASLTDHFANLSGRLSDAAEALRGGGNLPADSLVADLNQGCRQFLDLRGQAGRLAESLELSSWHGRDPGSLHEIGTLLHDIEQAEIERSKLGQVRKQALDVLDRVRQLAHSDQPDFPALRACQNQAEDLTRVVSADQPPAACTPTPRDWPKESIPCRRCSS